MAYCDNLNVGSLDAKLSGDLRDTVVELLRKDGFQIHEETGPSPVATVLGAIIDGSRGTISPTPLRVWRCIFALRRLAQRPKVSPHDVQVVLGHVTSLMVINRGGMSVARSLYDFAALDNKTKLRKLWSGAARECKTIAGILPLIRVDMRASWIERFL